MLVAEPDREGPIAVPAEEGGQLQPVPVHHHQAAGDEDQHQVNSEAELHQPFQFLVVNKIWILFQLNKPCWILFQLIHFYCVYAYLLFGEYYWLFCLLILLSLLTYKIL